jgi:hypothetical protein
LADDRPVVLARRPTGEQAQRHAPHLPHARVPRERRRRRARDRDGLGVVGIVACAPLVIAVGADRRAAAWLGAGARRPELDTADRSDRGGAVADGQGAG